MIHHITLTGRSIALACDGTVTTQHGAGGATGAVYVEASHLTLLHDMRDGEFYRTGQNSWSPSGWRRLSEAPMRIANEQRRRTAAPPLGLDGGPGGLRRGAARGLPGRAHAAGAR